MVGVALTPTESVTNSKTKGENKAISLHFSFNFKKVFVDDTY